MDQAPLSARRRDRVSTVIRYLTTAPLTFSWLAVLLATTLVQHSLSRKMLREVLVHGSTNLHHLAADPIRVLISSLFWIDGYHWWPYAVVFCIFLAPAERWLGSLRWLVAGLVAHIVATYVSEGFLYWQIHEAAASPRLINTRDIGVSYFVVGIIGLLTYHIARPWRWVYIGGAVGVFTIALTVKPGFTAVGHLCALAIGLCLYPLTRGRRDRSEWNPTGLWRRFAHRALPAA
jgi:hypothetical protein